MNKPAVSSGSKPKNPLSRYNLFFQVQHQRIIDGYDNVDYPITLQEVQRIVVKHKLKGKRVHRKSHGKIGFRQLAQTVATRWKFIQFHDLQVLEYQASLEKQEYLKALTSWIQGQIQKIEDEKKIHVPFHGKSRAIEISNDFVTSVPEESFPPFVFVPDQEGKSHRRQQIPAQSCNSQHNNSMMKAKEPNHESNSIPRFHHVNLGKSENPKNIEVESVLLFHYLSSSHCTGIKIPANHRRSNDEFMSQINSECPAPGRCMSNMPSEGTKLCLPNESLDDHCELKQDTHEEDLYEIIDPDIMDSIFED